MALQNFSETFRLWLAPPKYLLSIFKIIIPLVIAQLLQRLYPAVDNRYLSTLGSQALLIYNLQYNFVNLGQFIGIATSFSALLFWNRKE
jgi:Na+-driven multidrug efflux pump